MTYILLPVSWGFFVKYLFVNMIDKRYGLTSATYAVYIFIECILGIKDVRLGVTTLDAYMVENKLGILNAES